MAKEQLIIELKAEAKTAVKNLKNYTKAAKQSSDQVGKLTKIFKGYFAEIGAGILIARKIIKVVKDLTKSYMEQETAVARMEGALRATGAYTPTLSKELQQIASDLQLTSRFGDEATLQMTGLLQSLAKLNADGLKATIPLVHDFAEGMGIDMNTAASLIGKTLGSTTNALSRYGIVLDMTGTKSEKLEELTKAINDSFGGMARAMGETYSGQVTQLQNAFGDLKEVMGFFIADALTPMLKPIQKIITTTSTWLQSKKDLKEAYELLGKVAIEELDKISEAEATAAIKSIWAELQKIEPIIIAYKENITGLTLEQKKNLTTYLSLRTELKKYLATLSMEVTMTDELMEKYGLRKKKIDNVTDSLIELTKISGLFRFEMIEEEKARRRANTRLKEWNQMTKDALVLANDMTDAFDHDYTPALEDHKEAIGQIIDALGEMIPRTSQVADAFRSMSNIIKAVLTGNVLAIILTILVELANLIKDLIKADQLARDLKNRHAAEQREEILRREELGIVPQPIGSFQQGGQVQHLQTGGFGDRRPAMLERGEVVIDKFTAQRNAPAIGAMRGGEGGDRNVNLIIDGRVLARWIWKESLNKNVTISARAVI